MAKAKTSVGLELRLPTGFVTFNAKPFAGLRGKEQSCLS
jgi:hypothetical protein